MENEFEMSIVSELSYFLGLQIKQYSKGYFIPQKKYARNLIKKFELENCKEARTPISTSTKLYKNDFGKVVDPTVYRTIIENLIYLSASRSNILYSVGVCARNRSTPKESHLIATKTILRYVKVTNGYAIWYARDSGLRL